MVVTGQMQEAGARATTNTHDKTKSTNLESRFTLTETPEKRALSIYSSKLCQGVIIRIFGRIVRVGGKWLLGRGSPREC